MFRDGYADSSTELAKLIAANHYQEAERQVHSLRGAAMVLGLEEVSNLAAVVEQAIQHREIKKLDLLFKVLEEVLTPAIEAASTLDAGK